MWYELPMKCPKGSVEKAVGHMSPGCKGRVKTKDLSAAFTLYPVASDPNTSSFRYGPLITLDAQNINCNSLTPPLFRDNVCNSITHEIIAVTITCIHSSNT